MVVALDDMDGLQRTLEYTLKNVFQPKDAIHVLFMSNVATSDDDTSEMEATAALNSLADRILGAELPKEDYSVDLVAPSAPLGRVWGLGWRVWGFYCWAQRPSGQGERGHTAERSASHKIDNG